MCVKYYLTILTGMLHSFPQLQDRYKRIVNGDKGLSTPLIESFVTMFFFSFFFLHVQCTDKLFLCLLLNAVRVVSF